MTNKERDRQAKKFGQPDQESYFENIKLMYVIEWVSE